ncbi:MAG: GNAT family protein [Methanoregula sp.]
MFSSTAFLVGPRVYLRPMNEKDVEGSYIRWLNDKDICHGNSHHIFPYTRNDALDYIKNTSESGSDLILAVVLNEGDRHIGNISLQKIHSIYRSAEFAIIIGERKCWGKGLGLEAAKLIIDHGFSAMNLNRIECGTFVNNIAMQKLACSLGMKEEGRRRQAVFKGGQFLDMIEYGLLRSDYELLGDCQQSDSNMI